MDNLPAQNPAEETPDTSVGDSLRRFLAQENGEEVPQDEAPSAPAPTEEAAPEGEAPAEQEPEAPAAEPEIAEIEVDGETFKVPAKLKDGYLRQADYTKKTQMLAEERKATEAMKAATEQAYAVAQQFGPALAEFHSLQQRGEQFNKLDWNALYEQDPILHNKLKLESQENWIKFQNLSTLLSRAPQALEELNARALAAEVARNAPKALEWVPDLEKRRDELISVGREYGYSDQELGNLADARAIRALRDLAEYKKLTANRSQIQQKVASAPPVAKPGSRTQTPNVSAKDYNAAVKALRTDRTDDSFVNALRMQRKLNRG